MEGSQEGGKEFLIHYILEKRNKMEIGKRKGYLNNAANYLPDLLEDAVLWPVGIHIDQFSRQSELNPFTP